MATRANMTVRGQYRAGASAGGAVPGYLDELGSPASKTETFVALKAEIGNWRWAGVPFYLRTGKRLPERVSEIVVTFRPMPHSVFDDSAGPIDSEPAGHSPAARRRREALADDQGSGPGRHAAPACAARHELRRGLRRAQSRMPMSGCILDVVRGNQTLFMRRDEVEAAWSWIDPILDAGRNRRDLPKPYTAGTWGPAAAVALIERDGRTWHEDDAN